MLPRDPVVRTTSRETLGISLESGSRFYGGHKRRARHARRSFSRESAPVAAVCGGELLGGDSYVEEAGAGASLGEAVVLVVEVAALEAETAAADAAVEIVAEALEFRDAFVEPATPGLRQLAPVGARRRTVLGQRVERLLDLGERQTDPLRCLHERNPAQGVPLVLPLVAGRPPRPDQPLVLVEPQCRRRHSRPVRDLPDREPVLLARDVLLSHTATLEPSTKNSS